MSNTFIIDTDRERRLGFEEVIFGASKSTSLLLDLLSAYAENKLNVLITKLQAEKAQVLLAKYPKAFFEAESGIFMLQKQETMTGNSTVGIITAGSSDLGVANECFHTLDYMGLKAELIFDIGVAGIHRLMHRLDELKKYSVLIVIAGFEGALPTVMGGLLPQPIIAVPTSVGYGTAKNGETALHGMLTSCANGIVVTNIDNGYGAAMAALRIVKTFKK